MYDICIERELERTRRTRLSCGCSRTRIDRTPRSVRHWNSARVGRVFKSAHRDCRVGCRRRGVPVRPRGLQARPVLLRRRQHLRRRDRHRARRPLLRRHRPQRPRLLRKAMPLVLRLLGLKRKTRAKLSFDLFPFPDQCLSLGKRHASARPFSLSLSLSRAAEKNPRRRRRLSLSLSLSLA